MIFATGYSSVSSSAVSLSTPAETGDSWASQSVHARAAARVSQRQQQAVGNRISLLLPTSDPGGSSGGPYLHASSGGTVSACLGGGTPFAVDTSGVLLAVTPQHDYVSISQRQWAWRLAVDPTFRPD